MMIRLIQIEFPPAVRKMSERLAAERGLAGRRERERLLAERREARLQAAKSMKRKK